MMGQKVRIGVGQQVDTTDFHVEAIDLLTNHVPCEAGIAFVVALYSALKRLPVQAGAVILGDLSIQGNIKPCALWPSRCKLRWTTAHAKH
jgi:ATP-dependent Lon protease